MLGVIIRKEIVLCTQDVGDGAFLQGHVWYTAPIVESVRLRDKKVLKTVMETIVMYFRWEGCKLRQFEDGEGDVEATNDHGIDEFANNLH